MSGVVRRGMVLTSLTALRKPHTSKAVTQVSKRRPRFPGRPHLPFRASWCFPASVSVRLSIPWWSGCLFYERSPLNTNYPRCVRPIWDQVGERTLFPDLNLQKQFDLIPFRGQGYSQPTTKDEQDNTKRWQDNNILLIMLTFVIAGIFSIQFFRHRSNQNIAQEPEVDHPWVLRKNPMDFWNLCFAKKFKTSIKVKSMDPKFSDSGPLYQPT